MPLVVTNEGIITNSALPLRHTELLSLFSHIVSVLWLLQLQLFQTNVFASRLWSATHNLAFSAKANSLPSLNWTTPPTCSSSSRTYKPVKTSDMA